MSAPVLFIGRFRVADRARWESAITRMRDFVEANVPGARSFHAFLDADGREGTVVYVHPDAASLDQHLEAAAALIEEGSQMVEVTGIDVLGPASSATVERLRAAGSTVSAQQHVVGFDR